MPPSGLFLLLCFKLGAVVSLCRPCESLHLGAMHGTLCPCSPLRDLHQRDSHKASGSSPCEVLSLLKVALTPLGVDRAWSNNQHTSGSCSINAQTKNKHIFPEMSPRSPQCTLTLNFSEFQVSCWLCCLFGLILWATVYDYCWSPWVNRNTFLPHLIHVCGQIGPQDHQHAITVRHLHHQQSECWWSISPIAKAGSQPPNCSWRSWSPWGVSDRVSTHPLIFFCSGLFVGSLWLSLERGLPPVYLPLTFCPSPNLCSAVAPSVL